MKLSQLLNRVLINESKQMGQSLVLADLDNLAKQLGISLTIIGGVALQAYNYHRMTADVGILIKAKDAKPLGDQLIKLGYQFIGSNKFVHSSGFEVNLCADSVTGRQGFKFPSPVSPPGSIGIYSLEGIIALKAETNRAKDRADIVELIKLNNLDLQFIQTKAAPLVRVKTGPMLLSKLFQQAQKEKQNP